MTARKPPSKGTPEPPPAAADPLAGQPLDVIIEVLARASGEMQGLRGTELRQHIATLTAQVEQLAAGIADRVRDEELRAEAAKEAQQLIDTLVRTGTQAAQTLERHREPLARAIQNLDLARVAEGLHLLADWMSNPTPEGEAKAKAMMEHLERTVGPSIGYDPEREERERKQQIQADVKKSLDEIFKPKKFDISIKPPAKKDSDN